MYVEVTGKTGGVTTANIDSYSAEAIVPRTSVVAIFADLTSEVTDGNFQAGALCVGAFV